MPCGDPELNILCWHIPQAKNVENIWQSLDLVLEEDQLLTYFAHGWGREHNCFSFQLYQEVSLVFLTAFSVKFYSNMLLNTQMLPVLLQMMRRNVVEVTTWHQSCS